MKARKVKKVDPSRTCIVISDIHAGCQLGLCPHWGIKFDEGGDYKPSPFQKKVWNYWEEFWWEWVPFVTNGEPYFVVVNGDSMDGEHHGSKHQISTNKSTQKNVAQEILTPIRDLCDGRFYVIRGSRAHDGTSGEDVETLAKNLEAIPDGDGRHARYEMWKNIGDYLAHFNHHIGTTSSSAYEATAVYKEQVEGFVEAGRWGDRPADAIIRSHRHRYFKTEIATENERGMVVVTPGWQGKTPFAHKIAGARMSQPQFGGIMLRVSDEDEFYERHKVWRLERSKPE